MLLGLGSMVGTGVFVGLGLAAAEVGSGWQLTLAIVLAGGLALCDALSSAQLAAAHPVAGGTYAYGRRFLTPGLGAAAGAWFLVAKGAMLPRLRWPRRRTRCRSSRPTPSAGG